MLAHLATQRSQKLTRHQIAISQSRHKKNHLGTVTPVVKLASVGCLLSNAVFGHICKVLSALTLLAKSLPTWCRKYVNVWKQMALHLLFNVDFLGKKIKWSWEIKPEKTQLINKLFFFIMELKYNDISNKNQQRAAQDMWSCLVEGGHVCVCVFRGTLQTFDILKHAMWCWDQLPPFLRGHLRVTLSHSCFI